MNMTWGQFKKLVDSTEGVNDDVVIWYIDSSFPDVDKEGLEHPKVSIDPKLGLTVR